MGRSLTRLPKVLTRKKHRCFGEPIGSTEATEQNVVRSDPSCGLKKSAVDHNADIRLLCLRRDSHGDKKVAAEQIGE